VTGSEPPEEDLPEELRGLPIPIRWGRIDAEATLYVTYVRREDSDYFPHTRIFRGTPIEKLRQKFHGNVGVIKDPTGKEHEISLDPDVPNGEDILVEIGFWFVDPAKKGRRIGPRNE
jgi:hypothetical protein